MPAVRSLPTGEDAEQSRISQRNCNFTMAGFGRDGIANLASMLLVGALWGCTNPLLRRGSVEANATTQSNTTTGEKAPFLTSSLKAFLSVQVWLPYVLNQSGSIVFYILLAKSDLSLAVPICNALALLFSFITSAVLGEPIDKPILTFVGASLVVLGVTICVSSQEDSSLAEQDREL